jgi:hypothetical protein
MVAADWIHSNSRSKWERFSPYAYCCAVTTQSVDSCLGSAVFTHNKVVFRTSFALKSMLSTAFS